MISSLYDLVLERGGYDMHSRDQRPFGAEQRAWSGPGPIEQWPQLAELGYGMNGGNTSAGQLVTESTALQFESVYASVRILSLVDAAVPLHVLRDLAGGGTEKAVTDYRHRLIRRPNEEMTGPLFRMYMRQNKSLWGNSYAWIEWGMSNRADALWPMRPDWMQVYRLKSGKKVYAYDPPDGIRRGYYSADEMLHFRGLGDDLVGYSPIRLSREGIGLGMAARKFGSNFFRNGARPSGILTVGGKIDPRKKAQTEESFNEAYAGASNAGRVLMVDSDSKFVTTTIPPEDAQYLQTRQFQGGEISAKIYGVPAHLTGDTEKQTSWGTGVEQMSIGFVTYTLMPDFVLQEAEIDMKLLGGGLYSKYALGGLMRGDAVSRATSLQILRRNGVINADQWAELEDLNPPADGAGKIYIVEGNMQRLDQIGQPPAAAA